MTKLAGKVAVVTGASKGIGAGIAKALAQAGAAVVVNYSSGRDGAEKVVKEIEAAGGKAVAVQANVAKEAEVVRLFTEAKAAFGSVDVLVNNAGVYRFATIEQFSEEDYRWHFDINVLGLLLATREAVKLFGEEGGSIINIGSVATEVAWPQTSVYTATKAAVASITKTLANELGPKKIRVNNIAPGGVETEGTHAIGVVGGDLEKEMVAQTPLGRMGQPQDIASVAVFLASPEAGWVTGQTVFVSGGLQ